MLLLLVGAWAASRIPLQVILYTGTAQRSPYISLDNTDSSHGSDVCKVLPGVHAFTGCDTVSFFQNVVE